MIAECGLPIADRAAKAVNRRARFSSLLPLAQVAVALAAVCLVVWAVAGR